MPIDINFLREDKGGDPEKWREYQRKRFADPSLVDKVLDLDKVRQSCNLWYVPIAINASFPPFFCFLSLPGMESCPKSNQ